MRHGLEKHFGQNVSGNFRPALAAFIIPFLIGGCFRGMPSDKPPIHIERDMFDQPRYDPQAGSKFFDDGAAMRPLVPGTIGYGELHEDNAYYLGQDDKGNFIEKSPVPTTEVVLRRGQERFDIYCSPCHGRAGDGRGIVVQHGYLPPPSYHTDRLRNMPDGEIYSAIAHGVRNMPSYGDQVPVADRWAIVGYVRALQLSQNATIEDVPEEMRGRLKQESAP